MEKLDEQGLRAAPDMAYGNALPKAKAVPKLKAAKPKAAGAKPTAAKAPGKPAKPAGKK